jgi:hypothetical protein
MEDFNSRFRRLKRKEWWHNLKVTLGIGPKNLTAFQEKILQIKKDHERK